MVPGTLADITLQLNVLHRSFPLPLLKTYHNICVQNGHSLFHTLRSYTNESGSYPLTTTLYRYVRFPILSSF